eukprot:SAG11_NODE_34000_length_274_cov_0.800000_1_plen_47_part_10
MLNQSHVRVTPDSISDSRIPERARSTIAAVFDTEVEAAGAALLVPGL